MKKFKKYLRSSDFGVLLLIGSVIVQGFHSYFIFADLSNFELIPKIISSVFYAVVLSFAILYYTMLKKINVAIKFQWFESGINLYYFFKSIVLMLISEQINLLQVIPRSIIAIGIAIILPYTILKYADSIEDDEEEISVYYKKKFKKETAKEILQQINSTEDIEKLNQKYLKDE